MQDMATERRAAALLDRRHDLELAQAQMTVLRQTPLRPVGAENLPHLQGGARHGLSGRVQALQRADDLAQDLGGYLGV